MAFKTIANIITLNSTTLEFHYDYVLECEFLNILFMITRVTTSKDPLSYKNNIDNTNIPLQHYNPFAGQSHKYRVSMRNIKQSVTWKRDKHKCTWFTPNSGLRPPNCFIMYYFPIISYNPQHLSCHTTFQSAITMFPYILPTSGTTSHSIKSYHLVLMYIFYISEN